MATSVLAIINAKRVWRGASAVEPDVASSYPAAVNAVLVVDARIAYIGTTAEVRQRYEAAVAAQQQQQHQQAHSSVPCHDATGTTNHNSVDGGDARPVEFGRPRAVSHRLIDCGHRHAVYPGFIDSHVHFLDGGRALRAPDLSFAASRAQFVDIVRTFVETAYNHAEGGWVQGNGWSEAVLGCSPTRDWLDEVSTTIPLVMYSKDIHSAVMNEAALRLCHIIPAAADAADADSAEPLITHVEGGRIELDAVTGQPNGVLRDNAVLATKRYAPQRDTPSNQQHALEAAQAYLLARGFTSVFSMMSTNFTDNISDIAFLTEAERRGAMRLRVRYGVPLNDVEAFVERFQRPVLEAAAAAAAAQKTADDSRGGARCDAFTLPYRFTVVPPAAGGGYVVLGAVKLFSDGSLSSRTAAMNRPYGVEVATEGDIDSELEDGAVAALLAGRAALRGPTCQCGLLTMPRVELQAAIQLAHAHDLQCVVHAIGDRAVATVNRALCTSAAWLRTRAGGDGAAAADAVTAFRLAPRSRVEHLQHVANVAKEVGRMAQCGIIASMQPCHLLFDGDYIDALLGQRRKATSYIWGTLLRAGIRVDLGSDWPVAPADVNDGLRGAVTRVPDVMAALAAEEQQRAAASHGEGGDATVASATPAAAADAAPAVRRYHDTWNAAECISMDAALRTYTYEGAYGMFMEDFVGTLEVGKLADITVWSDDWLDESGMVAMRGVAGANARWWPRHAEPQTAYTIVGGVVEYERAAA